MGTYPVHYHVTRSAPFTRVQLAIRLVVFVALGLVGISFGAVFALSYLLLPAYAASRLAEGAERYAKDDGPGVRRLLTWLAAIFAWAGLLVDHLPGDDPTARVHVVIEPETSATSKAAMWRLFTGLPSALVLALLCWIGVLVWLWAALTILLNERVGVAPFRYLEGLQRWSVRLLAYQACLVDEYPPFSFADEAPAATAEDDALTS